MNPETNVVTYTHKQLAVNCFNKVWDILDKKERTDLEIEEMIHLCHTSFWHWTQVENHTKQNLSIGYWQLSRVYSLAGNGEEALKYANRCITVSEEADLAPFFIAYAYESKAKAHKLLSQQSLLEKALELAIKYTNLVTDVDSKNLLEADLADLKKSTL